MSQSPDARQDRIRVSQACENCRDKKSKCNGVKPVCGRCQLKELECHYGMTKRVKNQQVMRELALKVAQYESILKKNIPVQQMLNDADQPVGDQSINASHPTTTASMSSFSGTTSAPQSTTLIDPALTHEPFPLSPKFRARVSSDAVSPLDQASSTTGPEIWRQSAIKYMSIPPRDMLEQASQSFVQGSAILFSFLDEEEIFAFFKDVYENTQGSTSTVALTQLCAMAAVGCQFSPQQFDITSRRAFLSIAKFHLDECIEDAPLAAMRTATLLSVYYTFEKRTVALMYVEMGLWLSKMHRTETMFNTHLLTPWQRVYGSLIFLNCWLCATTGHLPSPQNRELHSTIALIGNDSTSSTTVMQFEMIKIALLSSLILEDVYHARFFSTTLINGYKHRLQQWLVALPEYMRLDYLLNAGDHTAYLRPIFMVHLFYMSTVTLIYRRVLIELACFGRHLERNKIFHEAQEFLEPCLWTGRQIAKILEIALSQGQILQKCWMFVNSTYSTCNILLYFVLNRLLHNEISEELVQDLNAVKSCIDVLTFCAELDEAAKQYLVNTSAIYKSAVGIYRVMSSSQESGVLENDSESNHALQELISLTARYLIHPFDGGYRREIEVRDDPKFDFVMGKQNILDDSGDTGMASPVSVKPSPQIPSYLFFNDLGKSQRFKWDSRKAGKNKSSSNREFSPFATTDNIIFGS